MSPELVAYDEIVHRIYDAALHPERWNDTLSSVAGLFEANRSIIYTFMHPPEDGGLCITHNLPQSSLEAWSRISQDEDPYAQAMLSRNLVIDGAAYDGDELVPRQEVVQSRMYRDIWVPWKLEHLCLGVIFDGSDAHKLPTTISLFRPPDEPSFTAPDVDKLRRIVLHLSRSLGVMFHLRDGERRVAASLTALDRLACGVVLLDGRGHVEFANVAAQDSLRRADCVKSSGARGSGRSSLMLAPRLGSFDAQFQRSVRHALSPLSAAADEHFSQALLLPDESGKPACVLHVAPLGHAAGISSSLTQPQAIVLIYDLTAAASVPPSTLRELFALTQAEARAAIETLNGGSAQDVAGRLGVSVSTFRSQLQAVYAKTRTHRQVDLLKLLLSLAVR